MIEQYPQDHGLIHEALLYRSEDGFADALRGFADAGRVAGEPVLAVMPTERLERAQAILGDSAGALRWESMTELARNPSCLMAVYQDWIDAHSEPVRIIGESAWPGRSYVEAVECLRHEALLNHELAAAQVSVLCPYDAERLDAGVLAGAELTHPQIVDDRGARRPSERYGEPLEVATGSRWPQPEPSPPISELVFSGDLCTLRHAVANDPIAGFLSPERRADLVFAINEAASNALKHGDGECATRLWRDSGSVIGEVATTSTIEDALVGRRRPSQDATDGRGLWLINHVCDLVELRSDAQSTVLRMHIRAVAA